MTTQVGGERSRFADHVLKLLERVECRQLESAGERDLAYKIRYDAYWRENLIAPSEPGRLYDSGYDESANARLLGIFISGEMTSTIRIHVARNENDALPSNAVFGDVILPRLRAGRTIVDPTRFATKMDFSRQYPELAYVTVRLAWLASEYSKANYLLATIRPEHAGFYRRIFGHSAWSDERDYPRVTCKIVCMGLDFPAHKTLVEARYPFFRSTWAERERLFGGLIVDPTVRSGRPVAGGEARARH
jgi:hypothetical protein